jgi:aryl-alcohol dehydrogenase-like predicted oxidoreductase
MQHTRLDSTGAIVSRLCFGMMIYGSKAGTQSSEAITGRAPKDLAPPRPEIAVATEVHGAMGEGRSMRGLLHAVAGHQYRPDPA